MNEQDLTEERDRLTVLLAELDTELTGAGFSEGTLLHRIRTLVGRWRMEQGAAEHFRTALASALDARESDGDSDLIVRATSLLGYVRWCRQQEGQIRLRSALAFLNSPFSFERLDLDQLTPQQNEWRRALLALKDLRTAVDGVNEQFPEVMDTEEFPIARRACLDITHNTDVLLALLSAREGREALLSLIPDIAEGGELSASAEADDTTFGEDRAGEVVVTLRGPWTPLAVEQYMRQVAEQYRESGRKVGLSVRLNPAS